MANSFKSTPIYKNDNGAWKNKESRHHCNKVIRRYCKMTVTIEYTEDGDPYEVYTEDQVVNRSNQKKIGTRTCDVPHRVYDGNLDRRKIRNLKKQRNFKEMNDIIHLILK